MVGILAMFVILGPFGRTMLSGGNEIWARFSYLSCLDAISLGILTALVASRFRFSRYALVLLTMTGISLVIFSLGCPSLLDSWGLRQIGLDMTVLALGTCLTTLAAAQSQWRAPRLFYPILKLGQRSYEVYLTHFFVLFVFFDLLLKFVVPVGSITLCLLDLFIIFVLVGEVLGSCYTDPFNSLIRNGWKKKNKIECAPLLYADSASQTAQ
jgi:peptidoglycan/LPS O-acetylase OafA/YrhL